MTEQETRVMWTLVVVLSYVANEYRRAWLLLKKHATRMTHWEPEIDLGAQGGPGYRCRHCDERRQYHFCPDKSDI